MKLFFLLLSFFLIFLLVIILAPVCINIKYLRENNKDTLKITFILLWGLIKLQMPSLKGWMQKTKNEDTEKTLFSMKTVKNFLLLWKVMRKIVICDKFSWKTAFGLSDAAQTGVLSGMIWSVKGNILAFLKRYFIFNDPKPEIEVLPDFKKAYLFVEIRGVFKFYPYRLLRAVLRMVYLKVRGGGSNWKIIQSRV